MVFGPTAGGLFDSCNLILIIRLAFHGVGSCRGVEVRGAWTGGSFVTAPADDCVELSLSTITVEGEMARDGCRTPPSISANYEIQFGIHRYSLHIRSGTDSWQEFAERLAHLDVDRAVLVVDDGLPSHFGELIAERVQRLVPVCVLNYPADEQAKNVRTLDSLAEKALRFGTTRRSVVVAVGGGIVGNVAGLLAALLFRGIRLVQVPTTLLGMSDSALSLKQAVNSRTGKNHLGVYWAPEFVWNYLPFVDTLPRSEVRSALCETVKNVLAIRPDSYDQIGGLLRSDGRYDFATLAAFIKFCIQSKCSVMRDDPQERGEALVLEYGHTVGHAVELLSGGSLSHGLAISIGMVVAARVAARLDYMTDACVSRHVDLLERNGAPTQLLGFDPGDVLAVVNHDNKRGYVSAQPRYHGMVLLDELGKPHRECGSLITMVPEAVLLDALEASMSD